MGWVSFHGHLLPRRMADLPPARLPPAHVPLPGPGWGKMVGDGRGAGRRVRGVVLWGKKLG